VSLPQSLKPPRRSAYTCPTSQVFVFSATCTNFVPEDNYSCATLRVNVGPPSQRKGAWRIMSPAIRHPHSPRLRASVANASHSFALRIAFWTNGPLITRLPAAAGHCFSNRHPCRLETTLNPSVPTTAPSLIVTQSALFLRVCGGLFVAQRDHGIHAHRALERIAERYVPVCGLPRLASDANFAALHGPIWTDPPKCERGDA